MTLHLIADDLRDHAWYEQLFVQTIADAEAYAARWAAFEQLVASAGEETGVQAAEPPA
jgi:hypothetical protein